MRKIDPEEALARLMVNEYEMINEPYNIKKTKNQEAYLEIRTKELELKEKELRMREYEQRQKDKIFNMQPTDHLSGVNLDRALQMKRVMARLKWKATQSAYVVRKEKRAILKFKELRFLATNTTRMLEEDAETIKLQKDEICERYRGNNN
ncbi:hypothetical protein Tco_0336841 [Tanacetum coccineum]